MELKPCPKCKTNHNIQVLKTEENRYRCFCTVCRFNEFFEFKNSDEAERNWNKAVENCNKNTDIVFVTPSVHNTINVYNYSEKKAVNEFLRLFDIWGSSGKASKNEDTGKTEMFFECSSDFYEAVKTPSMQKAFERLGVKIYYSYPYL